MPDSACQVKFCLSNISLGMINDVARMLLFRAFSCPRLERHVVKIVNILFSPEAIPHK